MNSKKTVIVLSLFTLLAGALYWLSVFTGIFPVGELVPGYRNWFLSFPLADAWLLACAGLAAWFAYRRKRLSVLFAALTGSSLIFLGLYAFAYGINTGLIFILTPDEVIEIVIKIYCLTAGALLIVHGWRLNDKPRRA